MKRIGFILIFFVVSCSHTTSHLSRGPSSIAEFFSSCGEMGRAFLGLGPKNYNYEDYQYFLKQSKFEKKLSHIEPEFLQTEIWKLDTPEQMIEMEAYILRSLKEEKRPLYKEPFSAQSANTVYKKRWRNGLITISKPSVENSRATAEEAAYRLDRFLGVFRVPLTFKQGNYSHQIFVELKSSKQVGNDALNTVDRGNVNFLDFIMNHSPMERYENTLISYRRDGAYDIMIDNGDTFRLSTVGLKIPRHMEIEELFPTDDIIKKAQATSLKDLEELLGELLSKEEIAQVHERIRFVLFSLERLKKTD